jgi:hypothetical protein
MQHSRQRTTINPPHGMYLIVWFVLLLMASIPPNTIRAHESDPSLTQSSTTVQGYLWNDANCDGTRNGAEGAMAGNEVGYQTMSLFYIGNDGIAFTRDDNLIDTASPLNGNHEYAFDNGGGGNSYYIAIRPANRPAGFVPSPFQQGGDPMLDNDMKLWPDGAWATSTFVIPQGTGFFGGPPPVSGIDIGLCPVANLVLPYAVNLPLALR